MANNRIASAKRAMILAALCEGMAINSVCRMFSVGKHAVLRLIQETGEACQDWHDKNFTDLDVARVELDEQWAYVHTHKERMTKEEKLAHPDRGDCWMWASIDAESKAILNWRTGKRTAEAARDFAEDLASRIIGNVQITTDELSSYKFTLPDVFGTRLDFAQERKIFKRDTVPGHEWIKYSVDPVVGVERQAVCGTPDMSKATTCHIERYFLTMRQGNKRFARKTLAYSKDWDNHSLATSIHIFVYNLVRRHEATKKTPAVALGIVDRRWTMEDVVNMTDAYLAAKQEAEFEAAFATASFNTTPTARRTYEPTPKAEILTPWYLDPESGGPNPPAHERKAGIKYEE